MSRIICTLLCVLSVGILQAQIEVGLDHPETAAQLKAYIKDLAKAL